MGDRIARPCSTPGCAGEASVRGKCVSCASEREAERNERRMRSLQIYRSAPWRRMSKRIRNERPLCEDPDRVHGPFPPESAHVDHIVRIEDGGDPWDEANLQALCHPCHSRKTRREGAPR